MTPHTRSPDPRDTGQARGVRAARGVAGSGSAPLTGSSRTGPVAGLAPGLVARVQRRLAATGASATDAAGLRAAVEETLVEDGVVLPAVSLSAIVRSIGDELTGLGPLAPLLADPTVTDVLVNGPADVWVERGGTIERAPVRFASAAAVAALVQRVVAPLGLRVDESRPWVDARLPGGERFHAVLPPLAPDGPVVTIRAFARRRLQLRDLIERGALDVATALAAGGDGRRRDRHRRVRAPPGPARRPCSTYSNNTPQAQLRAPLLALLLTAPAPTRRCRGCDGRDAEPT